MRLYLDTEFNGFGGELISMALVGDDGREWYAVLPEPRVWDKWCFENVLPVLNARKPVIYPQSTADFRASLFAFLNPYRNPIIIADWYTDLVHFFSVFGGRTHEESFAYSCRVKLITELEYESEAPHNALADARALRTALAQVEERRAA